MLTGQYYTGSFNEFTLNVILFIAYYYKGQLLYFHLISTSMLWGSFELVHVYNNSTQNEQFQFTYGHYWCHILTTKLPILKFEFSRLKLLFI